MWRQTLIKKLSYIRNLKLKVTFNFLYHPLKFVTPHFGSPTICHWNEVKVPCRNKTIDDLSRSGASILPEATMHFPLFLIPPISENLSDSVENYPNFTFSRKIFRFSSAKISDDLFLVVDYKFLISPLFSLFHYQFRENYYFPLLLQISPCFPGICVFFTYFMCISFPPTLTMMHLCITHCTYWTPLITNINTDNRGGGP